MKRFFDKVDKTEGCWFWKAARRGKYGVFEYKGKTIDAHRVSWEIHNGIIPEKLYVCHTCDIPLCVNPDHLFLGTHSENMIDAYKKGRLKIPNGRNFIIGHIPINRTLTQEQATELKKLIKNRSGSLKELAQIMRLPYQLLRDINSGRVYKNN